MPKTPPYFPFYHRDFTSDSKVEAMTTMEIGAYILLLCKAWQEEPPGSIPNDDAVLSRWTRLDPAVWTECRTRVLAPFTLGTDNRWHQKRMRSEFSKLMRLYKSRSEGGKKGAKKRWDDGLPNGSPIGLAITDPMAPGSGSDSLIKKEEIHSGGGGAGGGGDSQAEIFDLTPEGLGQTWCFYLVGGKFGSKRDNPVDMAEQFQELIRLGYLPKELHAAIVDRKRDCGEYFWKFRDRVVKTFRKRESEEVKQKRAKVEEAARLEIDRAKQEALPPEEICAAFRRRA